MSYVSCGDWKIFADHAYVYIEQGTERYHMLASSFHAIVNAWASRKEYYQDVVETSDAYIDAAYAPRTSWFLRHDTWQYDLEIPLSILDQLVEAVKVHEQYPYV